MGAEASDPGPGLGAGGSGDHRQISKLTGQLNGDRGYTAGAANDQNRRCARHRLAHVQPIEQRLPRRDGGQRQGGGLRPVERFRLVADDPLVHQVQFGVGALAGHVAGVEDGVARLEQARLRTDGGHGAAGVVAQDGPLARFRLGSFAHLGVDRVHRNRLHLHQDIAAGGDWFRQGDVDQGGFVVDGQ